MSRRPIAQQIRVSRYDERVVFCRQRMTLPRDDTTTAQIIAPPEAVWTVLPDPAVYADWNRRSWQPRAASRPPNGSPRRSTSVAA